MSDINITKSISRNMRLAEMNNQVQRQINELRSSSALGTAQEQAQLLALQQKQEDIRRQMVQPMSAAEAAQYDNNGTYIGQPENDLLQKGYDAATQAAQGISFGWSDELNGAIGGAGRVLANGVMQTTGTPMNESLGESWNKGYTEYRDFARQELQNGANRNPVISATSEIAGSALSPIKPFKVAGSTGSLGNFYPYHGAIARTGLRNAVTNGAIAGAGATDDNTVAGYGRNIVTNTIGNSGGNWMGNAVLGSNLQKPIERGVMNAVGQVVPQWLNWRNNDEKK